MCRYCVVKRHSLFRPSLTHSLPHLSQASTQQRYALVTEGGRLIGRLLKDTNRHLRVSQGMPDWRAYVDFVSNIVISGLMAAVQHSLTYLSTQLDAVSMQREQRPPVIEIELDLYGGRNVLFVPDIGHTQSNDGVRDRYDGTLHMCVCINQAPQFPDPPHLSSPQQRLGLGGGYLPCLYPLWPPG